MPRGRQGWATLFPWGLLGGFMLVLGLLFGDQFLPARTLPFETVVTAVVAEVEDSGAATGGGAGDSFEGETLFQASGWIEADPLPIRATTLHSGVVASVAVLEGETVSAGQLLATMVDDDARLDLETARADRVIAETGLTRAQAEVAAVEAALLTLDREIEAARGRLAELEADAAILSEGGPEAFTGREISQTGLRVDTQRAVVRALESRREERLAERASRQARVAEAEAVVERAETEIARRELEVERTRILSPVDGVIQQLMAAPGRKRMLEMDDPESATIAVLYEPESLQARIDVPLEEAARVRIGQAVRLRSALLPDAQFKGEVTRIEGQADLQRNTLQVKVRLLDPAPEMRPEMLCRGEFLGGGSGGAADGKRSGRTGVAIFVPEGSILDEDGEVFVWSLDLSGERIERRAVLAGEERREGYRRIIEGLHSGDRVLLNPPGDLREGERVRPAEAG